MIEEIVQSIFQLPLEEELKISETANDIMLVISLPNVRNESSSTVRISCEKLDKICGCDSEVRPISQCNCKNPSTCYINKKIRETNLSFAKYNSRGDMIFPYEKTNPDIRPENGFMKHVLGEGGGVAIGFYCSGWGLKSISFPHESSTCNHELGKKVCRDVVFGNVKFRCSSRDEYSLDPSKTRFLLKQEA